MYDDGGTIPRGQFGIVGENGPEIVNGPANVTSRRRTAALASVETLNFVVDILKVPSVLVGLIALIGLVAQKKAFSDVVKGTIKT
ncbi:hypothetical protein MJI46_34600, partial [Salmonella enterica subsp. enterica serovar Cerro]|nr:hypothetical protein [Salmonella enterica subsp. enterica serovar Cerro]